MLIYNTNKEMHGELKNMKAIKENTIFCCCVILLDFYRDGFVFIYQMYLLGIEVMRPYAKHTNPINL